MDFFFGHFSKNKIISRWLNVVWYSKTVPDEITTWKTLFFKDPATLVKRWKNS
jgi:hypothetical protein